MEKKKKSGLFTPVIVLGLIALISAGALGAVNLLTEEPIAERQAVSRADAMREVLAADRYEATAIAGVFEAHSDSVIPSLLGYVIETEPSGFGGAINLVTGVSANGEVTGIAIISMTETSGLGTNADKPDWRAQFAGISGKAALSKDGGTIDALTGATITSRAIVDGVNKALAVFEENNLKREGLV
ncbi:MAG: RnfABCDGE type electron transport complex subunit G [Oscillospiraceae bacterium]|jgi:electron transport complex protein RnfG|nr:RnfABCDGE type electron transport complex subunit G [Oscillospiraceae bacterium]